MNQAALNKLFFEFVTVVTTVSVDDGMGYFVL